MSVKPDNLWSGPVRMNFIVLDKHSTVT